MDEPSSSKVNHVIQQEIGPLLTFELLSQDTNDRINKYIDPANLEKDVGSSENNNMIVVYGGNNDNIEEDFDDVEAAGKSIDNKKNAQKLKKNEGMKEKKNYTRNFYNRCYPNKIMTEFEKMEENKEIKRMDGLKIVGFFGMTKMKLRRIHSDFIEWMCDKFNPTQLKVDLGKGKFLSLNELDVHRVYNMSRRPRRIKLSRCANVALRNDLEVQFNGTSKKLVN
ncbi:hypothetical protein LIER_26472 [Lithospermum erythrorhizon]|uniref:Uncharacterized protein n=1 Tax=Lithospermum erythrorhizon TaxID=34254 RepID=A0AAV3RBW1_LITER